MADATVLILGGARSGKSSRALALARPPRSLIATAWPDTDDPELAARIRRHRAERAPDWNVFEESVGLADLLRQWTSDEGTAVVDCMTLWLASLLHHRRDPQAEIAALLDALRALPTPAILVSQELGMGLVPETESLRTFRDLHGRMNHELANLASRVEFLVAGQPLVVKDV